MPSEATVHIIDDDDAVRHSLEFLLKTANIEVYSYDSGEAFLEKMQTTEGCVVTDIRMPGISGLDLMVRMKERHLNMPVIVITGHGDVPLAVEAMKLGATDFLEKPFDDDALLAAVNAALNRYRHEGARAAEKAQISERLASLTNRERQVLDSLVMGHPNKIIGYDLGISARTVEIYRANVMTKMQASSLSDLVRMSLIASPSAT